MTVSSTANFVSYAGNGATTNFPYGFYVLEEAHLVIQLQEDVTGDIVKTYVNGEYTVTGIGNEAGGTVTILGTPIAAGNTLFISRVVPYLQETDLVNQSGYYPEVVEQAFDYKEMEIQQIAEVVGRALTVPFGESIDAMPAAVARAGGFLAFGPSGEPVIAEGTGTDGALRTDLAQTTGAGLVGTADGSLSTNLGSRLVIVNTRTAMKALNTDRYTAAFLTESGRSGTFVQKTGTPPSDSLEGIYVVSDTANKYWERVWDKQTPLVDWWGAVINDAGTDSKNAINACIAVTGRLFLGVGTYYSSRGIALPSTGAVVAGMGSLHSAISISHTTDHLMSMDGTPSVSYANGPDLADFALVRSVSPTTPASSADDITQGHGLHFAMVSNPRVRSVYTYDNLVECYLSNILSPDIEDVRGIRQTGGGGDRWYGMYVDGVTSGGTFGGPSPNPSSTIKKPNMVARSAVGTSYNYYLAGALQDLWIVDPEAAAGTTQYYINSSGGTAGDFHIVRPIADGYATYGIHVKATNFLGSLNITDAWIAPKTGATSSGVRIESSSGVKFSGRGDFSLASGLIGVEISDSSLLNIEWHSVNCQSPVEATSLVASEVRVFAAKNYTGAAFGSVAKFTGGSRNKVTICAIAYDTQQWTKGFDADATAAGYHIDVSGIAASTTTDRVNINASVVTTQGNVSGHVIINPGAGAML